MRAPRGWTVAAIVVAAVAVAAMILGVVLAPAPAPVARPSGPSFRAGDIISDDSFYNPDAMTAGQVQRFLETRSCIPKDSSPCLADFRMDTPRMPASSGRCTALPGRSGQRASGIIADIARACTISPRVLLVLVQKEQSLITAPSASGYQKATGYACPDTAACDQRYFGFFNQVYRAAWQFREYTVHPQDWRYQVGTNSIQYNPAVKCGSSTVDITNQATANLYNYTPYQPDRQTLAQPHGPGGPCGAYGNLNFSRLYHAWFGDPLAVRYSGFVSPCLVYEAGFGCTPLRLPGS